MNLHNEIQAYLMVMRTVKQISFILFDNQVVIPFTNTEINFATSLVFSTLDHYLIPVQLLIFTIHSFNEAVRVIRLVSFKDINLFH